MKKKKEALMDYLNQVSKYRSTSQVRQIRPLIKMCLTSSEFALTSKEIHVKLKSMGYQATSSATRIAIHRLTETGEVMVCKPKPCHYFII